VVSTGLPESCKLTVCQYQCSDYLFLALRCHVCAPALLWSRCTLFLRRGRLGTLAPHDDASLYDIKICFKFYVLARTMVANILLNECLNTQCSSLSSILAIRTMWDRKVISLTYPYSGPSTHCLTWKTLVLSSRYTIQNRLGSFLPIWFRKDYGFWWFELLRSQQGIGTDSIWSHRLPEVWKQGHGGSCGPGWE